MTSVLHVATTGSDAADGSEASPFRTISGNPKRAHAECRLARRLAFNRRVDLSGYNRQFASLRQFVARDVDTLSRRRF